MANISTSRCIYVDGVHVARGINCPHESDYDEVGEVHAPGWTAQSGGTKGNP